jgi:hypothetical protein
MHLANAHEDEAMDTLGALALPSLAKTLAVRDEWFADEIGTIGRGKDAAET